LDLLNFHRRTNFCFSFAAKPLSYSGFHNRNLSCLLRALKDEFSQLAMIDQSTLERVLVG
jgi:hypothetical protein